MKLHIDTSSSDEVLIMLDDKKFSADSKVQKAQALLPLVEEALGKEGKGLTDLTEVTVNTGPGSFTGLRVGVSVALALGWALGLPVNGSRRYHEVSQAINYDK